MEGHLSTGPTLSSFVNNRLPNIGLALNIEEEKSRYRMARGFSVSFPTTQGWYKEICYSTSSLQSPPFQNPRGVHRKRDTDKRKNHFKFNKEL